MKNQNVIQFPKGGRHKKNLGPRPSGMVEAIMRVIGFTPAAVERALRELSKETDRDGYGPIRPYCYKHPRTSLDQPYCGCEKKSRPEVVGVTGFVVPPKGGDHERQ